jgi:hypothetical protein
MLSVFRRKLSDRLPHPGIPSKCAQHFAGVMNRSET